MNCNINTHLIIKNSSHAGASHIPQQDSCVVADLKATPRGNNRHLFMTWSSYNDKLPDLLPDDILINNKQNYPRYIVRTITKEDCLGLLNDLMIDNYKKQVIAEFEKDPKSITVFEILAPGHYLIMQPKKGQGFILLDSTDITETISFAESLSNQGAYVKKFFDIHVNDVIAYENQVYIVEKIKHGITVARNKVDNSSKMFFAAEMNKKFINFLGVYDPNKKEVNFFAE